jgi:hypothetical protein
MTWLRSADPLLVFVLESARVCLIFAGCIVAGWVVGYAMGYRQGASEGNTNDIITTDHRAGVD